MTTPLTSEERDRRIEQYASAPGRLRETLAGVPAEAMKWRPEPAEFSVHEIVCHCADSETNAYSRIRYLLTEEKPVIVGYDPDVWARQFNYTDHPLDAALATVEAVRANTAPLLRHLPDEAWEKEGHAHGVRLLHGRGLVADLQRAPERAYRADQPNP